MSRWVDAIFGIWVMNGSDRNENVKMVIRH
jgi:hypothetical protein